jgi:hypothetical protein
MATEKDITHKQGFTPSFYFTVQNTVGNQIDIVTEGWTFEYKVRRGFKPTAPVIETFSTANGKLVMDLTNTGRVNFVFDGTEFNTVTIKGIESVFRYDLQGTDGTPTKHDLYYGNHIVTSNL